MIYFVLVGIVITWLTKRRLKSLFQLRFRMPYILIIGLIVQVLLAILKVRGLSLSPYLFVASFAFILTGLCMNWHYHGIPIIFAGTLLNICAVLFNGGAMPVSETAIHMAGLENSVSATDVRHQQMTSPALRWLGDYIPVPHYVLSPGDVLVGTGVALFIIRNTRTRNAS